MRLQRLDAGDHLAEVVLVPPAPEGEDTSQELTADEQSGATAPAIPLDARADIADADPGDPDRDAGATPDADSTDA